MLRPNDRLGRWAVERHLGENGQGRVYLARDHRGAQAALKVPHGNVRRFVRELEAALAVNSSFVARVWDYDVTSEPPYIAYAVVPGEPLYAVLARRPPGFRALLSIFADVAQGLADIHSVSTDDIPQLSHGDVSLDNIMATDKDRGSLIDLGAAITGNDSSLSRNLIGKLGYFTPEQLLGSTGGPASDVWQLAVCIARAGTGFMPFGSTEASLRRITDQPPNVHGLDGRLARVIAPCLLKDPQERPSASDLAQTLKALLKDHDPDWEEAFADRPVQDVVRLVDEVAYDIGKLGRLGLRARLAPLDADRPQRTVGSDADVAAGDQVLSRPSGNGLALGPWSRPMDVVAPPAYRAAERQVPQPPHDCPACGTELRPTDRNWRGYRMRRYRKPGDVHCPNALHCAPQHDALWSTFLRWLDLDRVAQPLTTQRYSLGRWPHVVIGATEDEYRQAEAMLGEYWWLDGPRRRQPEPWAAYSQQQALLARELLPDASRLLSAYACPLDRRQARVAAHRPRRNTSTRTEHPAPVGLKDLLEGAMPYPGLPEEPAAAVAAWWAERHEPVLEAARALSKLA